MYTIRHPHLPAALLLVLALLLAAPAASAADPATEVEPPAAEQNAGESPQSQTPSDTETQDAPKAQQPEEGMSEDGQPEPNQQDAPAEESNQPEAGQGATDANEQTAEQPTDQTPELPIVTWDSEIQKVVAKKHPETVEDLRVIQKQVRQVVKRARLATVGVRVGGAVGSAVIVSEDGMVLTAGHVAMKPNIRVKFFFADGRVANGITLGVNRGVDSGMMRITDKGPWPFVPMATPGELEPGDWVIGLGQPNGFFRDRAPPVRLGRMLFGDATTLCTDVTLVGGDSGGPLLNLKGEVVGIHSRIGRRIVSNFHVPVGQFQDTWDRLAGGESWGGQLGVDEEERYRPMLGLAVHSAGNHCEVTQVFENFPAERAGIQPGDILKRFDDAEINSVEQLGKLILAQKGNARVKIELERDGKDMTVQVRLTRVPTGFPGAYGEEESDS